MPMLDGKGKMSRWPMDVSVHQRGRKRSAEINLKSDVTKETKERERESGCGNSEGIRFEGGERKRERERGSADE